MHPRSLRDAGTAILKTGNILATVVLALKSDGTERSELEKSLQKAFVDLPIELTLEWQ